MTKSVGSQAISNDYYVEVRSQKSNLEKKNLNEKAKTQQLMYVITTEEQHKIIKTAALWNC